MLKLGRQKELRGQYNHDMIIQILSSASCELYEFGFSNLNVKTIDWPKIVN